MSKKELSFYEAKIKEIGFNPKKHIGKYSQHPDEPHGKLTEHPLYWENKHGDLCIGFLDLYTGLMITYDDKFSTNSRIKIVPYYVKRLKNPIIKDGKETKYLPGVKNHGTFLYFHPLIVEAYREGKEIDTLIATEGQNKAFVACEHGLYCIGVPGITMLHQLNPDNEDKSELRKQFVDIIVKCKVKTFIFLTDADTKVVTWKEGKDLRKRPNNFFHAVSNFKKITSHISNNITTYNGKVDCFFMHIKKEYNETAKGLDDLINTYKSNFSEIRSELLSEGSPSKYFQRLNVSQYGYEKIKDYFNISLNTPSKFYDAYQSVINDRKFIYCGREWQYDIENLELKELQSEINSQFIQINNTFYKKGYRPANQGKILEPCLIKMEKAALLRHFNGNPTKLKNLLDNIDFYDGMVTFPSHIDFKYAHETVGPDNMKMRFYNQYYPLSHEPKDGPIDTSLKLIKHIFGDQPIMIKGKEYPYYELGLDYMQLLYMQPTQKLPILSLVSNKTKTGKTTMIDWIRAIFQQNVKSVTGNDLNGQFTAYFAGALVVAIEEAFISKKEVGESIKKLTTAKDLKLESKGKDAEQVENHIKIVITSNNEEDFALIDPEDSRYWVLVVPQLSFEDVHFYKKLVREIPAFLYYLSNREMVSHNETRTWFAQHLITTEALKKVIKQSRPRIIVDLDEIIKDIFALSGISVIGFTPREILRKLDNNTYKMGELKKSIKRIYGRDNVDTATNYTYCYVSDNRVNSQVKKGRAYFFYINEFFDNWIHIIDDESLIELEKKLDQNENITLYTEENVQEFAKKKGKDPSYFKKCSSFAEAVNKLDKELIPEKENTPF